MHKRSNPAPQRRWHHKLFTFDFVGGLALPVQTTSSESAALVVTTSSGYEYHFYRIILTRKRNDAPACGAHVAVDQGQHPLHTPWVVFEIIDQMTVPPKMSVVVGRQAVLLLVRMGNVIVPFGIIKSFRVGAAGYQDTAQQRKVVLLFPHECSCEHGLMVQWQDW